MVSARRNAGFLRPTTPGAALGGARQREATTSATDRARMRSKAKAGLERASTLWRHAHAAQERVNAPGKETRVMTDADRDEIADRLARQSKARLQESRRLIEASKR
jgi:hypothetical protein